MERLVKEILTISKIEMEDLAGKKEPVSLSDTLTKVTESLEPLDVYKRQIILSSPGLPGHMRWWKKAVPSLMRRILKMQVTKIRIRTAPHLPRLETTPMRRYMLCWLWPLRV